MDNYAEWHRQSIIEKLISNLKANEFEASYFDTGTQAADHIRKQCHKGMKVAFGGSMSVRTLGIREIAREAGTELLDHGAPGLSDEEKLAVMRRGLNSDLYLCSTNAITLSGSLINADGYGNRVASMIFGPLKVIVIAGLNKIVYSEEAGFDRLRNIAAPMNMKRLNRNTPCTADGLCHNCRSAERGCRAYTIIRRRPAHTQFEVIIIGETLGI